MQITGEYANSAAEKIKASIDTPGLSKTDRLAAL